MPNERPPASSITVLGQRRYQGTGNSISFDEIGIDRHAGGRIAESWWLPDRFTLWQQFGLVPDQPIPSAEGA